MIDDAISRIKRAMTEGTFDFGQVCCGAYEWSGSPDEPPECCGRPLSCADDVRALLAEVGRLRKENHDLNWALGTDGYATLSDPEDQAASDAAHAAAFANLDRLKARKTRHETLLPDGRDALDEIERLREALTAANAQAELHA